MPIFEELIKRDDLVLVAGGAAQNTARGAQYIYHQIQSFILDQLEKISMLKD